MLKAKIIGLVSLFAVFGSFVSGTLNNVSSPSNYNFNATFGSSGNIQLSNPPSTVSEHQFFCAGFESAEDKSDMSTIQCAATSSPTFSFTYPTNRRIKKLTIECGKDIGLDSCRVEFSIDGNTIGDVDISKDLTTAPRSIDVPTDKQIGKQVTFTININSNKNDTIPINIVSTTYTYESSKHLITFNTNGHGTAPDIEEIDDGSAVTRPSDPTASGYYFAGWYKDQGCTTEWDFSTVPTKDTMLYARWIGGINTVKSIGGYTKKGDLKQKIVGFGFKLTGYESIGDSEPGFLLGAIVSSDPACGEEGRKFSTVDIAAIKASGNKGNFFCIHEVSDKNKYYCKAFLQFTVHGETKTYYSSLLDATPNEKQEYII